MFPTAAFLLLAAWSQGWGSVVDQVQGMNGAAILSVAYLALLATLLGAVMNQLGARLGAALSK